MRIGHGYDVHQLVSNRNLILGGCKINYHLGLLGHSDADVLVHAIIDSLLGAASLGDIGQLFPDNSDKFKDANSLNLLKITCEKIARHNFKINNIDSTIIAQEPRLSPFLSLMRLNIANICNIDITQVSVKSTTEEHLGFTGKLKGIAAHAVCTLV